MLLGAVCCIVGVVSTQSNFAFLSPRIPKLHNARIAWRLPTGTTLDLKNPTPLAADERIGFVLKGVYFGKHDRHDVEGYFKFWSKDAPANAPVGKLTPTAYRQLPLDPPPDNSANALFYAGGGDFLLVGSPKTDPKTIAILNRLYRRIKVVG
jgi:hypothetical protein